MRDFTTILILTAASLGLAVLFFLDPAVIGSIPYGAFTFTFASIVCFWVAWRLRHIPSGTTEDVASLMKTLRAYFFVMGFFFFFDGWAHVGIPVFYPLPLIASHAHTFSHIFFFIGNAIIIRIPVSFINRRWMNAASMSQVIFGVVTIAWRLGHLDTLVYAFGPTMPPLVIVDRVSDTLFLFGNGLALLLPGLYLVYLGLSRTIGDSRVRAVMLGLGMMIFFSVGPVIDLIQNQYTQLIIHLCIASSFGLMGASAFYRTRSRLSEAGRVAPPQAV